MRQMSGFVVSRFMPRTYESRRLIPTPNSPARAVRATVIFGSKEKHKIDRRQGSEETVHCKLCIVHSQKTVARRGRSLAGPLADGEAREDTNFQHSAFERCTCFSGAGSSRCRARPFLWGRTSSSLYRGGSRPCHARGRSLGSAGARARNLVMAIGLRCSHARGVCSREDRLTHSLR